MIITISGLPGSGKSTIGRLLAERLGYRFYSMGDLRGKMALERGLTIDELNELGVREAWTDREIDEYQKKLGETEDNFVIDGWLSFHFIPRAFKVFLEVNPEVGTRRIYEGAARPDEPHRTTLEETRAALDHRVEETDARYAKYYNLSFRDRSKFDLVIDTTTKTAEEVAERIRQTLPKQT